MKIVTLSPEQFDKFAQNHRYRNYYQSSAYGNVMVKFGYNIHYLGIVSDQNKLIGATLIIYKEIFILWFMDIILYKFCYFGNGFYDYQFLLKFQ